jgi:trehalose utilization protein
MSHPHHQSLDVIAWSDDTESHNAKSDAARALHPHGVAVTVADALRAALGDAATVTAGGLHEPEQGVSGERLAGADVLVWWGHLAHDEVTDATAGRVQRAVLDGLGLVVLHSGHHSKPFRALMGTSCDLEWREADDEERIWTVSPGHPIAAGVERPIHLPRHEMYGEPFEVPVPEELVFVSAFSGGEAFRSGCCWTRGAGRIFYFSPGHETDPVYDHPQIRLVLANGVRWAARTR